MDLKQRSFRPGDFALEPRTLLSVAEVSPLRRLTKPLLSETLEGRFQYGQDRRAADAPLRVKLAGVGLSDRKAKLAGTLDFGGLRLANAPDIEGVLTLSNSQGTLKLQVTGAGGNRPIVGSEFRVNAGVIKGTGAYSNVQAVGPVTLSFSGDAARGKVTGGQVRLALDLVSPVR